MSTGEQEVEGMAGGFETGLDGQSDAGGVTDGGSEEGLGDGPIESAKDSLEKFLGDIDPGELSGDKDAPQEEKAADASQDKPVKRGKDGKFTKGQEAEKPEAGDEFDPELSPPERLKPQEKQLFNNLPKGLRRGFHRLVKDLESGSTKEVRQAQETIKEWAPLREAIAPFATDWAAMGVGVVPGILQLASAQKRLTSQDASVREAEYLKMAQRSKIDIVKLARKMLGQNGADSGDLPDLSAHPVIGEVQQLNTQLSTRLQSLESRLEAQQIERKAAPLLAEMEAVRNEKDPASGKLLRPALHDEAFLNSVKPLVSKLVRHDPNLTYPAALRKAHDQRMREVFGDSYQASSSRPPAPNGTNTHRALASGISVRGRPAPTLGALEPEIPADAAHDAKSSLEWFMRGGSSR